MKSAAFHNTLSALKPTMRNNIHIKVLQTMENTFTKTLYIKISRDQGLKPQFMFNS